MGAAESSSAEAATVDVALEQNEYYTGDTVRGYVQANVKRAIPCLGIFVELDCEARTVIDLGPGSNSSAPRKQSGQCVDALHPVAIQVAPGSKDRVAPGKYQIPFEFVLPKGAPPTVEVANQDQFYASTAFTIRIRFRSAKKKDSVVKTYRLRVFNKPRGPLRSVQLSARKRLRSCWCVGRGHLDLKAVLDRDAYKMGEVMRAQFEVVNRTSFGVRSAIMYVNEFYEVSANGNRRFASFKGRAHVSELTVPANHEQQGEMTAAFQFLFPSVDTGTIKIWHEVVLKLSLSNGASVKVRAPVLAYGYHKDTYLMVQPSPRQQQRDSTPFKSKAVKMELADVQPVEPVFAAAPKGEPEARFAIPGEEILVAEPIDWVPDAQIIEASSHQFTLGDAKPYTRK